MCACSQLLWLLTRDLTARAFHCLMQLWKAAAFPPEDCGFSLIQKYTSHHASLVPLLLLPIQAILAKFRLPIPV